MNRMATFILTYSIAFWQFSFAGRDANCFISVPSIAERKALLVG